MTDNNNTCPLCGSGGYAGLTFFDCSNSECENFGGTHIDLFPDKEYPDNFSGLSTPEEKEKEQIAAALRRRRKLANYRNNKKRNSGS